MTEINALIQLFQPKAGPSGAGIGAGAASTASGVDTTPSGPSGDPSSFQAALDRLRLARGQEGVSEPLQALLSGVPAREIPGLDDLALSDFEALGLEIEQIRALVDAPATERALPGGLLNGQFTDLLQAEAEALAAARSQSADQSFADPSATITAASLAGGQEATQTATADLAADTAFVKAFPELSRLIERFAATQADTSVGGLITQNANLGTTDVLRQISALATGSPQTVMAHAIADAVADSAPAVPTQDTASVAGQPGQTVAGAETAAEQSGDAAISALQAGTAAQQKSAKNAFTADASPRDIRLAQDTSASATNGGAGTGGQNGTQSGSGGSGGSGASNGSNGSAGPLPFQAGANTPSGARADAAQTELADRSALPQTGEIEPEQARRPQPPLTPERLSGLQDARGLDDIAGGLQALRGDAGQSNGILAPRPNPALQQNLSQQLNLAISRAVEDGETQFTLRLNPAELGRVTVRLSFGSAGDVRANILVQNPETLELLQRDVRGLERALEAGGHRLDGAAIEMSLDKGDQESAGRALADALMEEKMRDSLAAGTVADTSGTDTDTSETAQDASESDAQTADLLEDILPHISPETGVDIRV